MPLIHAYLVNAVGTTQNFASSDDPFFPNASSNAGIAKVTVEF